MSRSRHRSCEDGASAVEFALVLPVLILLLVGIAQFGITFSQWLAIEHAAREGARWGSLGYIDGNIATADTVRNKVWAAAPGLSPRLSNEQIGVIPADPASSQGQPVEVTVTYPTPVLPLMTSAFGTTGPTFTLTARAVLMIE